MRFHVSLHHDNLKVYCYGVKALETNDIAELRRWLIVWVVLTAFTLVEWFFAYFPLFWLLRVRSFILSSIKPKLLQYLPD